MVKIKNVSPFGDLDIPLLGRIVAAGEIVEVTDEEAAILLMQESNYQPVGKDAREIAKANEEMK